MYEVPIVLFTVIILAILVILLANEQTRRIIMEILTTKEN
jgi:hypothetical protein